MRRQAKPLIVNGWQLFAHPLFLDQLEALVREVGRLKVKDPAGFAKKNAAKRLAAISDLAFETIPQDPTRADYRHGGTLGEQRRHWLRAKFYQQYRLLFRYHLSRKVIVYAWVNDEDSKRAYESRDDAYRVFARMLDRGNPPEDWDALVAQASCAADRLRALGK